MKHRFQYSQSNFLPATNGGVYNSDFKPRADKQTNHGGRPLSERPMAERVQFVIEGTSAQAAAERARNKLGNGGNPSALAELMNKAKKTSPGWEGEWESIKQCVASSSQTCVEAALMLSSKGQHELLAEIAPSISKHSQKFSERALQDVSQFKAGRMGVSQLAETLSGLINLNSGGAVKSMLAELSSNVASDELFELLAKSSASSNKNIGKEMVRPYVSLFKSGNYYWSQRSQLEEKWGLARTYS